MCENPLHLPRIEELYGIKELPCTKCILCRRAHALEWSNRVLHETYGRHLSTQSYVTLTYAPAYQPRTSQGLPTLCKTDFQDFIRELRRDVSKGTLHYYACGEYGTQTHRPHFHAILIGVEYPITDFSGLVPRNPPSQLTRAWTKGFITCKRVHNNNIGYVCQYTAKKNVNDFEETCKKEGRCPPFQLQSNGIGLRYCMEFASYIRANLECPRFEGRRVGLPRYYRKKLELPPEPLQEKAKQAEVLYNQAIDQIPMRSEYAEYYLYVDYVHECFTEFFGTEKIAYKKGLKIMHEKGVTSLTEYERKAKIAAIRSSKAASARAKVARLTGTLDQEGKNYGVSFQPHRKCKTETFFV
ncbi:MAG: hypothetical protein Ta2A_11230 [Treponemataceae bacterium]|nr:MAG: hypothetical protein Ta2A_11230 [Treponemataceae bacterium]